MLFPRDVQRLLQGVTPTCGVTGRMVKRQPGNAQHHPGICSLAHPPLLAVGMIQLGRGWSSAALLWDLGYPWGHRDEASGHPTWILLSTSRCQRGENQNHPEMLCWAPRDVVSRPWFPNPVRGRSCSSPSPWMDLSVGSLKTRKKSQFSAPLEPLRVLILLLWVLLSQTVGLCCPLGYPRAGIPIDVPGMECCHCMRPHPFFGWKTRGMSYSVQLFLEAGDC